MRWYACERARYACICAKEFCTHVFASVCACVLSWRLFVRGISGVDGVKPESASLRDFRLLVRARRTL